MASDVRSGSCSNVRSRCGRRKLRKELLLKNKRATQAAIMINNSVLAKEALTSLRLSIQRFIGGRINKSTIAQTISSVLITVTVIVLDRTIDVHIKHLRDNKLGKAGHLTSGNNKGTCGR